MATRYSGNLTIRCTYRDQGNYKCTVTPHDERGVTVYVTPPRVGFGPGIAYDSPEAYDQVAKAAISSAGAEGLDVESSDGDEHGWIVSRTQHPAYARRAAERRAAKPRGGSGGRRAGGGAKARPHGDKVDYRKIEIFVDGRYVSTTTWSPTCRDAVQRYLEKHPGTRGKVTASFGPRR